jgi:6-phosphogluconolactonase
MITITNRWVLAWLVPLALLPFGCGEEGGEGGGGGTLGGAGTTAIVYVTNSGSNDVSGYTINSTGALAPVPGSPFNTNISKPSAVVVSSNGFFAYVANSDTNKVLAFRVSTDGGLLLGPSSDANPNPVSVGTTPGVLAISPDAKFLYVANSGSDDLNVFSIGAAGVLTPVTPTGSSTKSVPVEVGADPASIATTKNRKFLYVANRGTDNVTAFAIDSTTGLLTRIPSSGGKTNPISTGGKSPKGMSISTNSSFLYVANSDSGNVTVFKIEADGLLTLVSPTPIPVGSKNPNALILSDNGRFLYSANGEGNVTAFTIGDGGLLTLVPSSGGNTNQVSAETTPVAMTMSVDGRFLYTTNREAGNRRGRVSAYTVNEATGALTRLNVLQQQGVGFLTGDEPSSIATPGRP